MRRLVAGIALVLVLAGCGAEPQVRTRVTSDGCHRGDELVAGEWHEVVVECPLPSTR